MNFWTFLHKALDRFPGWPTERQWVTIGLFILAGAMLKMAEVNPKLWDIKLFEILIQAIVLTGLLNMVLAFHFTANKSDETKADNTGKFADAMKEQAITSRAALPDHPEADKLLHPGETARAVDDETQ